MSYKGDEVSSTFVYQSSSEPDTTTGDGHTIIRASDVAGGEYEDTPPTDEMKCLFIGRFKVDFLHLFVKSMERHTINIRLSNAKPLLIEYPLGSGPSTFVRFILAQNYEGN
jgi:hypothetical protein